MVQEREEKPLGMFTTFFCPHPKNSLHSFLTLPRVFFYSNARQDFLVTGVFV
jgi:hypothetical protein